MDIRTQLSQRAPALYVLPGMICGLLLARAAPAESAVAFTALALGLISWLLARREQPKLWLLAFMASSALGFWFYGSVHLPPRPDAELLSVPPREAVLSLKIVRVMQPENKFGKSTGIARVLAASATSRVQKNSLIYFRLSREDTGELEIMRGLTFEVKGVLLPISGHVAPDSFDAYLKDTGIHYRMEQTTASRILKPASSFMSLCHETNIRFQEILRLGEPPGTELSQIYIAMLLGQKTQLSQEQKERFRITGTMHLFAISGLHIGAIATVIWQMLLLCRLPPKMTPFLGLPLLYFYVEVTGGTPSAIRAFLMVAFFWASIAVQRQRSPLAALAASAVFVLIVQPSQLWQMGFQLSYLVVVSILLFGLPLREKLWPLLRPNKYLPKSDWSNREKANYWLADKLLLLLAISFSAWLASVPLSAGFFGFIAPYAVLINVLLVNLATLVISGGVISLTTSTLGFEGLSAFLNHSAWLGISLMDTVINFNLELPWATLKSENFPAIISYLGVLAYISSILILEKTKYQRLRFMVPPAVVIATLVIGIALSGQ